MCYLASEKSLSMSVMTVPPTPPDMALFEGKQTNNFLGTFPPASSDTVTAFATTTASPAITPNDDPSTSEDDSHKPLPTTRNKSLGVCFVSQGTYDILVQVTEVSEYGLPLPVVENNTTSRVVRVIVEAEDTIL